MSYFEEGDTVPPPFNILPSMKTFRRIFCCSRRRRSSNSFMVSKGSHFYELKKRNLKKRQIVLYESLTFGRARL